MSDLRDEAQEAALDAAREWVSDDEEAVIRRSERHRLANLFEGDVETLSAFAGDKRGLVELIVLLLRVDEEITV